MVLQIVFLLGQTVDLPDGGGQILLAGGQVKPGGGKLRVRDIEAVPLGDGVGQIVLGGLVAPLFSLV